MNKQLETKPNEKNKNLACKLRFPVTIAAKMYTIRDCAIIIRRGGGGAEKLELSSKKT